MNQNKTSQRSKVFVSRAGWYSLRHPIQWEVEEDEGSVALYDPEQGVGALHISAYKTPAPADPREELLEHLSDNKPPAKEEDITVTVDGTKTVASFEYVVKNSFHKLWFISDKGHLVLANYNCDSEDKDKEMQEVENVVRSIELARKISRNQVDSQSDADRVFVKCVYDGSSAAFFESLLVHRL